MFDCTGIAGQCKFECGRHRSLPIVSESMLDAGWEFIGHGLHQKSIQGENQEEDLIAKSLDLIERFTGARPRDGSVLASKGNA